MSKRERILSMAVGSLLLLFVVQWGINKYRAAVRTRTNLITQLREENAEQQQTLLEGAYAENQMDEYIARSLPSNRERAQSDYQSWLLEMLGSVSVSDPRVNPTTVTPSGDLYNRFSYSVDGGTDLPSLVGLLHSFYSKDYLHGISKMTINPARDRSGMLDVKMSIDVLALSAAPSDTKPVASHSWRTEPDVSVYLDPILNRNFYEPPNQAPVFDGRKTIEAIVGKSSTTPLTFKDPEGHRLRYELISKSDQKGTLEQVIGQSTVKLDPRTGTVSIRSNEKREFNLLVRAVDDGYPSRVSEQTLTVRIVDPPPPPKPVEKFKFDDAKQTVLTALVQGRQNWTAWLNIRTRGETLKLAVGDTFDIGSLKGSVVEVTPKYVVLESDGKRFELTPAGILAEAAKTAKSIPQAQMDPSIKPSDEEGVAEETEIEEATSEEGAILDEEAVIINQTVAESR
ncbi:hypothetical protein Q31b_22230 [Novipirellula aureliae]|uniref:Cadherin domain-containing protein n=1 Tax=Novipirellula aureliae TaxID=2527966 RepID=A0A5C6E3C4_9BACT|nr:cadherin repeat domain-containing protein [Novipirellula aureliae]TWU43185.1 hypothetical protein Q31b_22230 [Novipirellula aureliae]